MAFAATSPALAQSAALPEQQPSSGNTEAAKSDSLWTRDKLLGDLGGVRSALAAKGIALNVQETSEGLGNVTGGVQQGAIYEGSTLMSLSVDTQKLLGLSGGMFNVSAFQIHGRGLTANNLDNLNVVSSIEAPASTRLFELRYDQSFLDGKASIRIGQLAADQEFLLSQYGALFINSGFGWPTLAALDLPEGGPAYPLATPGIRLKVQPTDQLALLGAIFNGDPADNGSGTSFRVNKGVFAIAEAQYSINGGDHPVGLPGTYKVGAWYNSNAFADQRVGADGLPLADAGAADALLYHRGNWSVYAVADQMIYRVAGTKDQGLGLFFRFMGAPSDRNLVDFDLYTGANYKGIIPGRPDDTAGVGLIYTRVSDQVSQLDMDFGTVSGGWYPVRHAETVLELTYQVQMAPWWTLQPDFQYVFNPGGSLPNPNNPTQPIADAAVFGLRTTIQF
ncbi:MAG: carbohydrate porin [Methylovirgula sp.]